MVDVLMSTLVVSVPTNDRQSSQRSFDMNNYFSQTAEYDRFKIKRQDIGVFDPQFPNPKGQGAVTDGSRLVFTDVHDFMERVYTLLEDSSAAYKTERQIKAMFSTLLAGAAVIWWTTELTNDVHNILRSDTLADIMHALKRRFTPDRNTAMASFNKGKLRLQDIAADPDTTNQYIQRILRYARDIGMLTANRSNWHRVMATIWGSIDREIRFVLKAPKDHENLADFIKR